MSLSIFENNTFKYEYKIKRSHERPGCLNHPEGAMH